MKCAYTCMWGLGSNARVGSFPGVTWPQGSEDVSGVHIPQEEALHCLPPGDHGIVVCTDVVADLDCFRVPSQRPEDDEVVRLKRDQRAPQQWGLPPPPPEAAEYSQWSGSADFEEPRRWQPNQPAADNRQQVSIQRKPVPPATGAPPRAPPPDPACTTRPLPSRCISLCGRFRLTAFRSID